MKVHLINVTEAEARASLAHHGDPICAQKNCDGAAEVVLLFKSPHTPWGQKISCAAACEEHRADIELIIDRDVRPLGKK